jgi:hypothetical protein
VWSLKRERWGSLLVQEKYREEETCDKRQPYRIIIIIIIAVPVQACLKRDVPLTDSYQMYADASFQAHNFFARRVLMMCVISPATFKPNTECRFCTEFRLLLDILHETEFQILMHTV